MNSSIETSLNGAKIEAMALFTQMAIGPNSASTGPGPVPPRPTWATSAGTIKAVTPHAP